MTVLRLSKAASCSCHSYLLLGCVGRHFSAFLWLGHVSSRQDEYGLLRSLADGPTRPWHGVFLPVL